MNTPDNTEHDTLQMFEASHFAVRATEQFTNFRTDILSKFLNKKGKLLEIGSKSGHFLMECRKAGLDTVGTEVSESHIAKIKRAFPDADMRQNDVDSLPFESESFDYVVSFQVLVSRNIQTA